jgi:hypothetical protein
MRLRRQKAHLQQQATWSKRTGILGKLGYQFLWREIDTNLTTRADLCHRILWLMELELQDTDSAVSFGASSVSSSW